MGVGDVFEKWDTKPKNEISNIGKKNNFWAIKNFIHYWNQIRNIEFL